MTRVPTPAEKPVRMPPGPRLPRVLQTLGFLIAPPRFIEACHRRYGDAVTFSTLFDSRFVMVFEPDLVKQVFRAPPISFGPARRMRSSVRCSASGRFCSSTAPSTFASGGSCSRPFTASASGPTSR